MNHNTDIEIIEQLPGYIGWKDNTFCYLGCNRNLSSILQLKHTDKIIGTRDNDLPGCTEELFQFHKYNDELVLNGHTVKYIHKSASPYDGSFFYFIKKPMVDRDNNITGLIFHCIEFIKNTFFEKLYHADKKYYSSVVSQTHYQIDKKDDPLKLSTRELECLFCILRGMTAKQIGERIQLSKRTIESYIENIKNKFGCRTKSELFDSAINKGYPHIIPTRFLQDDFLNILK
jgi:DNA-binding CsgD family transcriptional regulator